MRNLFRLKKEQEEIKDGIIRYIWNLYEHKREDYYQPLRVGNFWSNSYIEYESNSDRNKTLSIEEHLNKVRPYLKDIINDLKESNAWKIQLTITINFISSKDSNEERVLHSKSYDIEIVTDD